MRVPSLNGLPSMTIGYSLTHRLIKIQQRIGHGKPGSQFGRILGCQGKSRERYLGALGDQLRIRFKHFAFISQELLKNADLVFAWVASQRELKRVTQPIPVAQFVTFGKDPVGESDGDFRVRRIVQ